MDVNAPSTLLGGLRPTTFMRRHWQEKPLLVRQAWPGVAPPLPRSELFELAGKQGVQARLVTNFDGQWRLRQGPLPRRALPPIRRPGWTLLVQGLDLHVEAAHEMLARFAFVPVVRLDDLMLSYASDGGGVGPHLDSYDVFLLQVHGRRRWRIAPAKDRSLIDGLPLKILRHFQPTEEWLLAPGDMLYLPPGWAHEGVAEGECMTASIGFRAPGAAELAHELLLRLADDIGPDQRARLFRDSGQGATATPGRLPAALREFAAVALRRALADPQALSRALGGVLSEPQAQVCFEAGQNSQRAKDVAIRLDRRSRMAYDERHVFLNGEAHQASGRDALLMARLADARRLDGADVLRLGRAARLRVDAWLDAGWLQLESQPALKSKEP